MEAPDLTRGTALEFGGAMAGSFVSVSYGKGSDYPNERIMVVTAFPLGVAHHGMACGCGEALVREKAAPFEHAPNGFDAMLVPAGVPNDVSLIPKRICAVSSDANPAAQASGSLPSDRRPPEAVSLIELQRAIARQLIEKFGPIRCGRPPESRTLSGRPS